MSVFSYNEATAEAAGTDLAGVVRGLEVSLADLGGFVAGVRSQWDGDEQETYAAVQARWDRAAGTVQEILGAVTRALESTTTSVRDMRAQVRGALSVH
ncbi:WXG100 family type VII secretion target [Nakamurella endophytica]|uniref:ESAT-6-like protein n=1 Tax=Nakamurella endophytica TaxID=1748367 RepID=A0A917SU91_9ACTN|nr:WXG100 family type VII secretion target [Nakamurella endophytica]GGL96242.1 hypothetical protein GCM10011594_14980 [Nakamurella endophytica]